jgi:hypothetical protein
MAVYDWYGWSGAAAGSAVSQYVNAKVRPLFGTKLNNATAVRLAFIAAQIFQVGTRNRPGMAQAVDGAAEWAVGSLIGDQIAQRFLGVSGLPAPVAGTVAPAAPAVPATTAVPAASASTASGPVGVPASSGSSAFDLPVPGY